MISIVICDDEKHQTEKLRDIIQKCIDESKMEYKIELCTDKASGVINYLEESWHGFTVFFLDINLKSETIDGIQLGSLIRKLNLNCELIYLTAFADKAILTFENELECADFILKTEDTLKTKERIMSNLVKIRNRNNAGSARNIFAFNNNIVDTEKLMYIETCKGLHKLIMHYESNYGEIRGNIAEIEKLLPDYFFRLSRSVIVNKSKIDGIDLKAQKINFYNGSSYNTSSKLLRRLKASRSDTNDDI